MSRNRLQKELKATSNKRADHSACVAIPTVETKKTWKKKKSENEKSKTSPEPQKNHNFCYTCNKKRGYSNGGECSRRKKLKTNEDLPDFSLLPDVVLIKIFSYLNLEERCTAAGVCLKWYQISRSACLWKQVALHSVTASKVIRVLPELTPAVRHLQLSCAISQRLFPMWLPDIVYKLHQQCPRLKTLILEGAALVRHLCYGCSNEIVINAMLKALEEELLDSANLNLSKKARKFSEQEYGNRPPVPPHRLPVPPHRLPVPPHRPPVPPHCSLKKPVLPQLEVLSLRRTMFNTFLFFAQIDETYLPNIKVLDLTSALRSYARHITRYSRIEFLEELYLPESALHDLDIELLMKSALRLKVLDFEHTDIGDAAIAAIKRHGHCLERLYLANTKFTGFSLTLEEYGSVLPRLHTLCIRMTPVTLREVERMLHSFPSLRQVDVTFTEASLTGFADMSDKMKEKLILNKNAEYLAYCDHFYASFHPK